MSHRRFHVAFRFSPLLVLMLIAGGCHALKLNRAGYLTPADWVTEGDSPQRHHAVDVVLEPPLEAVWKYNAGGGFGPTSPLVVGNTIFVATRKGEVHAIDLGTGKKVGQTEFGDAIEGSPAIGNATLYVPVGWGGRALQAYDLERARARWKVRSAPVEAGLLLHDRTLVAADVEGFVRAYDTDQGSERWAYRVGERVGVEASPVAVSDRLVVVADDGGQVTALDLRDGRVQWTRRLGRPVQATPATDGATVFVATTRGRFVALDAASGAERWAYDLPDTSVYLAAPALSGGEVVFGGSDGVVRSLDAATGTVRWARAVEGAVVVPPLLTQRALFVGTMHNQLYALDRATGEVRWSREVDGRVKSPMAYKDGALVVLCEPRTVYLFKHAASDYASSR